MNVKHPEQEFDLYCEWGRNAVERYSAQFDTTVIIDILSFTTCVDLATSQGASVFPWPLKHEGADELAALIGGRAAGRRGSGKLSLSPESMLQLARGERAVLPSPNGSALTMLSQSPKTIAACLRNAEAVAAYLSATGGKVLLVPSGEQWGDGRLRPAHEDWLGAGAVATFMGCRNASSEVKAAAAAFEAARHDLKGDLGACHSGRELIMRGYESDVALASDLNATSTVPILSYLEPSGTSGGRHRFYQAAISDSGGEGQAHA